MCHHAIFESPDDTRIPDKTKVDIVRMGGTIVRPLADALEGDLEGVCPDDLHQRQRMATAPI